MLSQALKTPCFDEWIWTIPSRICRNKNFCLPSEHTQFIATQMPRVVLFHVTSLVIRMLCWKPSEAACWWLLQQNFPPNTSSEVFHVLGIDVRLSGAERCICDPLVSPCPLQLMIPLVQFCYWQYNEEILVKILTLSCSTGVPVSVWVSALLPSGTWCAERWPVWHVMFKGMLLLFKQALVIHDEIDNDGRTEPCLTTWMLLRTVVTDHKCAEHFKWQLQICTDPLPLF